MGYKSKKMISNKVLIIKGMYNSFYNCFFKSFLNQKKIKCIGIFHYYFVFSPGSFDVRFSLAEKFSLLGSAYFLLLLGLRVRAFLLIFFFFVLELDVVVVVVVVVVDVNDDDDDDELDVVVVVVDDDDEDDEEDEVFEDESDDDDDDEAILSFTLVSFCLVTGGLWNNDCVVNTGKGFVG